MKKGVLLLFGLGIIAFTSCKRDYKCTCGNFYEYEYTDLNKNQAKTYETECKSSGCTWSKQ